MKQELLGLPLGTWGAIGDIATAGGVLLAAAGAWFAWGQLKTSQGSRLDQNRPYVVVTIESGIVLEVTDIVIRNVGAGPARNVSIKVDPPLARTREGEGDVLPLAAASYFNETIPLMPPGYRLATFFDSMIEREKADPPLPKRYTFTASYDDGHGHAWSEENVVDLSLLDDLVFTTIYTEHHIAEALRDIRKELTGSPLLRGRIDATVETRTDRETRQEREGSERRAFLRQMKAQRRQARRK